MTPRWQDVRCASIPVDDLSVLADLRREPGIRVTIADGRAWVCWDDEPGPSAESEATRRILVTRLLPRPGVEIFARSDGRWHRPGEHLPAFGVPVGDGFDGVRAGPRDRARADLGGAAGGRRPRPGPAPDRARRGRTAPARRRAAMPAFGARRLGRTGAVVVDRVDLRGVVSRADARRTGRGRGPAARARRTAPRAADGLRYWGADVLIPIGYRAEPDLAERALRSAVGAGPDVLVVLDADGPELVPRQAFRPMSRAGIRQALAGVPAGRMSEEARS